MATLEIFKYLSDAKETRLAPEGSTIQGCLIGEDLTKKIITVNGLVEENPFYIIKKDDVIQVRNIPTDPVTATLIVMGVSAAVGVVASIVSGVEAYKARQEAQKATDEAKALTDSMNSAVKDDIINIPYTKGASNTVATNKTQPYIMGRHLFTPYILNGAKSSGTMKGYHTIQGADGEDVYYNVVLEGGFNKQAIESVYTGDTLIKSYGPQVIPEGKEGLSCSTSWCGDGSFIEIAQDGNDFDSDIFNQKIVEASKNDTLAQGDEDDYEDKIYSLESNAMAVDIGFMFNGLLHYTKDNAKTAKTRVIVPYYSLDYNTLVANGDSDPDANATWVPMTLRMVKHHDEVKTINQSVYTWKYTGPAESSSSAFNTAPVFMSESQADALALANKANWTLNKGSDVRDDYDELKVINVGWYDQYSKTASYTFTIICYKESITPAYDEVISNTNTISGTYTKQIRFTSHADFALSDVMEVKTVTDETSGITKKEWVRKYDYPIAIKVTSQDSKSSEGSDVCTCYIQFVQSYCYDETKTAALSSSAISFVKERIIGEREAALSTLIGLHIKSTSENEDSLGSIQVISTGLARTWDSTAAQWSTEKEPTSNPAAWFLEVLTSDKHTPSQITSTEESALIDFDSLGKWYEYCESKSITFNYVLTSGMAKNELLSMILTAGHAAAYRSIYGKIAIAIDDVKDNAIAILNEQNLISLSYKKDMTRRPDGVRVKYIDESKGFQEESFIVMYNQYDADGNFDPYGENRGADCVLTELSATGCTNWYQAYFYALYVMKSFVLRPRTITAQVGEEGIFYTLYDKIYLTHPALKIGLGSAEIKSVIETDGYITGLELCEPLTLNTDDNFSIVVECVNEDYCSAVSFEIENYDGRTNTITFKDPISASQTVIPHPGNILSYGYEVSTVFSPMVITGIQPNDTGYELTLVDYNTDIFDRSMTIKQYVSNLSQPVKASVQLPSQLPGVTIDQLKDNVVKVVSIVNYWAVSEDGETSPAASEYTTTNQTTTSSKRYLWSYTIYTYSDGTKTQTTPAVIGVHGETGAAGSGFIVDLSEEVFVLLDTFINTTGSTFSTTASLYKDSKDYSSYSGVTWSATLNGAALDSSLFDGNTITVPCNKLSLVSDSNILKITCTYEITEDGETYSGAVTAQATITKVYSGSSPTIYKMLLSDTAVKIKSDGTQTPEQLNVSKRKLTSDGESDTNSGYITAEYDDEGEENASRVNYFENQADKSYDSTKTYYEVTEPFMLCTDDTEENVLGNGTDSDGTDVAGVFYN